jgi:hypothetical protein
MRMAATRVPGDDGEFVFAPVDMVLHSATHLFHEGELEKGLRDLVDIESLLSGFACGRTQFWDELVARAGEVGLTRPLYYALRYSTRMLGAPVPEAILAASEAWAPPRPLRWLMDVLYLRALRPDHPTCSDWFTPVARWALYVRGHWLRMPLPLLVYHLARKAFMRERAEEVEVPRAQGQGRDR